MVVGIQSLHGIPTRFCQTCGKLRACGFQSGKPSEVEPVLQEAFDLKDKLVFIDFITDQEENVWPMVQGKGLSEMILGSEDL